MKLEGLNKNYQILLDTHNWVYNHKPSLNCLEEEIISERTCSICGVIIYIILGNPGKYKVYATCGNILMKNIMT